MTKPCKQTKTEDANNPKSLNAKKHYLMHKEMLNTETSIFHTIL